MEISPPWFASAEVAIVLASLVKLPVAVMVTFPAVPGGSSRTSAIWIGDGIRPGTGTADLAAVREAQRADIHRNVAGPARAGDVLLLIVAPFERLMVPTFSTTSPPRPLLVVLVSMETLSRVNVIRRDGHLRRHSAAVALARDASSRRRYRPSPHRWSHSLPPLRCLRSTGLDHSPIRQADRLGMHRNVARTSRRRWYRRRCRNQVLKGRQNPPCFPLPSPCTVTVAAAGALGSALPVRVLMVAPPERLACWTLTTMSPPRPTSVVDALMVVAAPSIVKDLDSDGHSSPLAGSKR